MSKRTILARKFYATWQEGGSPVNMTATAEIGTIGNQDPCFTVTAEIQDKWGWSGGMQHEEIRKHIPQLAPFLKWHLTGISTGPMHYIANALYWAGHSGWCDGKPDSPPNLEYWKQTIVFGAAPDDPPEPGEIFTDYTKEEMTAWLKSRFEDLMAAFDRNMGLLFPEYRTKTRS